GRYSRREPPPCARPLAAVTQRTAPAVRFAAPEPCAANRAARGGKLSRRGLRERAARAVLLRAARAKLRLRDLPRDRGRTRARRRRGGRHARLLRLDTATRRLHRPEHGLAVHSF